MVLDITIMVKFEILFFVSIDSGKYIIHNTKYESNLKLIK